MMIVFTSFFSYMSIVTLTFDLWPPKSIEYILSPWLTSAKFDKEIQNSLVSILFTSLFPYTVYSFEFAQSYFRPAELWIKLIPPVLISPTGNIFLYTMYSFIYN